MNSISSKKKRLVVSLKTLKLWTIIEYVGTKQIIYFILIHEEFSRIQDEHFKYFLSTCNFLLYLEMVKTEVIFTRTGRNKSR